MRQFIMLLLSVVSINAMALDIRDLVADSGQSDIVKEIDPDKMIFGIPLGTTEDEFIKKYGKPTGYIQITKTDTGMLYGKRHFFFFEDKKLSGITVTHNIVDWEISQEILSNTEFDRVRWKLNNGIKEGMNRADVKNILGDRLKKDKHGFKYYYTTDKSKVFLGFSHYVDAGEKDEAYTLYGITVRVN